MRDSIGPTHHEYVAARRADDPEFAAAHDEARVTMGLALALTDLRELRGLSQRALAERCGMKQPMIARIERGSQVPKPFTLLRILGALNGILTMLPDGAIQVRPAEALPIETEDCNGRETALVASPSGRIAGL
jgi:ribosome-binding protein aMBF1 (putative translation factor)